MRLAQRLDFQSRCEVQASTFRMTVLPADARDRLLRAETVGREPRVGTFEADHCNCQLLADCTACQAVHLFAVYRPALYRYMPLNLTFAPPQYPLS